MIKLLTNSKYSIQKIIRNLIGIFIVIGFAYYIWENRELFQQPEKVSTTNVITLSMLILLSWLSTSAQSFIFFRHSGSKIRFFECYLLSLASTFGNFLPMRAGTIVRAHYMKSVHNLDYIHFGSIFSVRLILVLIASSICGIIALLSLNTFNTGAYTLLIVFTVLILLPSTIYLWKPFQSDKGNHFILRAVKKFSNGIYELKRAPIISISCLILIFIQLILLGLRFQIAAEIINHPIELPVIMVLVSLATIAAFTAITPGGLGIREALMGYATLATGTAFSLGMLIGSVDRLLLLIMTAILGGLSFLRVWYRLSKALPDSTTIQERS